MFFHSFFRKTALRWNAVLPAKERIRFMIKELAKSIWEYKRPSILAPILVSGEVMLECIIPFIVARLVNQIKAG